MRTIGTKRCSADEKWAKFSSLESQRAVSSKGRKPNVSRYQVNDSDADPAPAISPDWDRYTVCGKMTAGYD